VQPFHVCPFLFVQWSSLTTGSGYPWTSIQLFECESLALVSLSTDPVIALDVSIDYRALNHKSRGSKPLPSVGFKDASRLQHYTSTPNVGQVVLGFEVIGFTRVITSTLLYVRNPVIIYRDSSEYALH
jgi:hypothetical protein